PHAAGSRRRPRRFVPSDARAFLRRSARGDRCGNTLRRVVGRLSRPPSRLRRSPSRADRRVDPSLLARTDSDRSRLLPAWLVPRWRPDRFVRCPTTYAYGPLCRRQLADRRPHRAPEQLAASGLTGADAWLLLDSADRPHDALEHARSPRPG